MWLAKFKSAWVLCDMCALIKSEIPRTLLSTALNAIIFLIDLKSFLTFLNISSTYFSDSSEAAFEPCRTFLAPSKIWCAQHVRYVSLAVHYIFRVTFRIQFSDLLHVPQVLMLNLCKVINTIKNIG